MLATTQENTIRIDAALIDERIYEAIKERGPGMINYTELAREIGCSKNTIYRSLNRKPNADRIRRRSRRQGASVVVEAVYA